MSPKKPRSKTKMGTLLKAVQNNYSIFGATVDEFPASGDKTARGHSSQPRHTLLTFEESGNNILGEGIAVLDDKGFTAGTPAGEVGRSIGVTAAYHFERLAKEHRLLLLV